MPGPIDIVIEYVDNTDSVWQAEFNKYFSFVKICLIKIIKNKVM